MQHRERFEVEALTAHNNVGQLIEQANVLRPKLAVIANDTHYQTLKNALAGTDIEVASGDEAVCAAAEQHTDWVMAAIVGAAGLKATMAAIRQGATVALANKECLVCAGELMMQACQKHGATLLPVDSEHNAIFQVLNFTQAEQIEKITLTASGGPFRGKTRNELTAITPKQAVAHPNWDMGAKISVDSATMMNKGLEMIEAYHLFPVSAEQIAVIVHPESIIHSLVHYRDGSVLAQLGMPDMRIPIAYTLAWPERMKINTPGLNLAEIGNVRFEMPDENTFPALRLARKALKHGGAAPIILNAANEIAVDLFLKEKVKFLDITHIVETTLEKSDMPTISSIDDVIACDGMARRIAQET